jgi:hypothetical protein
MTKKVKEVKETHQAAKTNNLDSNVDSFLLNYKKNQVCVQIRLKFFCQKKKNRKETKQRGQLGGGGGELRFEGDF